MYNTLEVCPAPNGLCYFNIKSTTGSNSSVLFFCERLQSLFSQFCNSHAYSIPLAHAGSMLYAIPCLLDIYTIDAHSIHFHFCSLIAFPSLLEQCYILMQYLLVIYSSNLVLLLVSFNVYVTPSFFQLCSLSVFFFCLFFYTFYTFQFKFDYLVILSF